MKKITLICFGKLKTPGFSDAVGEFVKRLPRYTHLEIIELKQKETPEKETEEIEKHLNPKNFLWCLDEKGQALKTKEWGDRLRHLAELAQGDLTLVIGGAFGLTDQIRQKADLLLSFGPQTLSHELARLVLIEQLYRALSLNAGHPYHNEG